MVEKTDYNILNPEWWNEVEGKKPSLGERAKQMLNRLKFSIGDALMTGKQKKNEKIKNEINIQKNRMIEKYNNYTQETKDEIEQELKNLYEDYIKWRLWDVENGDWPVHYRDIKFKESSNQDYHDFFSELFDNISISSSYEELKRHADLVNEVIKEIIWKDEMKKIYDKAEIWQ